MHGKQRIPFLITQRLVDPVMTVAVDFDARPSASTIEVEREETCGVLMSELKSVRPLAQFLPEQHLRQRHLAAQASCVPNSLRRLFQYRACPFTMLRMVPLPKTSLGRI